MGSERATIRPEYTNIVYSILAYTQAVFFSPGRRMPKSVFTNAYDSLRSVLVEARKGAGLTQTELSARVGRPQPFISKVESGVRRIDIIEFCVIARALGQEPAALFATVLRRLPGRIDI
jgi:Helix-turn-helix